jgi:subtilisin family serine protease
MNSHARPKTDFKGALTLNLEDFIEPKNIRRALKEGDGEGVEVAILDTGIEADHPGLEGSVVGCWEVVQQGRAMVCRKAEGIDPVGHGTACAGIIHGIAPKAKLYGVRVIGGNAQGSGDQFAYGLHWAIQQKFHVVNLSLGTLQQRYQSTLQELADQAYYHGICLVAAAHNQQQTSYPSHFSSLIAVDSQSFSDDPLRFNYNLENPIEMEAHGIYVHAPSSGGKYQLWTGTSFACPHISAIVAKLLSVAPELTPFEIKTLLRALRQNR